MISFQATLKKFGQQGEKTGWTYFEVPADLAAKLKPGNKKSFRVKGKLDKFSIAGVALLPMGGGIFIMAVNAAMRKGIAKKEGAMIKVQLEADNKAYEIAKDFLECLEDEPTALKFFRTLIVSHQNYFSKWIESAKTEITRTKRIAMAVNALSKKMGYPEMIRAAKAEKNNW